MLQIQLQNSALNADGSGGSASVQASGSNKAKLKKGVALYKDVRLQAETPGTYVLRVVSASRKIAAEDATVAARMAPANFVTNIKLDPESVPAGGLPAGTPAVFSAIVTTEDGQPLQESAGEGLTVRLTPPGGARADAVVIATSAEPPPASAGDSAWRLEFPVFEPLTAAGVYTVAAEYVETRADLARALPKKQATMRSQSITFEVVPGALTGLSLEPGPPPERVTASNGPAARERTLLKRAVWQLRDDVGNAVETAGKFIHYVSRISSLAA